MTHLGDIDTAEDLVQQALALYPTQDYLDRALAQLDLAQCRLHQRDLHSVEDLISDVLGNLLPEQRLGMIHERSLAIISRLPRSERNSRQGRILTELVAGQQGESIRWSPSRL